MSARTEAAVYGAVVGLGAALVLDNLVVQWLVGLHRLVQVWSATAVVEPALFALGLVMTAVGIVRERNARRVPQVRRAG